MEIFWAINSKTLFSNFFSALYRSFSWPSKSSLNFYIAWESWNKMAWDVSISIPISWDKIFLASSRILNSWFLSSLNLCCLAFFCNSSPKICIWSSVRLVISQLSIRISSSKSISSSLPLPLHKNDVLD